MIDATMKAEPSAATGRLIGHPTGLWVLAGANLWERISFYGMQALLVLYMAEALLKPGRVEHVAGLAAFRGVIEAMTGPLGVEPLAAQIFGLYVGCAYFTPVIGGWLGDRWIRRRTAVVAGGLAMAAGHVAMAFDATFLLALLLLVLGAGLFMGNLSPQVKALYADGDRRESDAFQIYYVSINLGAFIAPFITGALAAWFDWSAGFLFAAGGMVLGVVIYLIGQRHLPPDSRRLRSDPAAPPARMTREERRRFAALWILFLPMVCFWIAQSQVWNVYNLWVRDHVQLTVGAFQVPVPWIQAFDGLAPILVLPVFLALWRWQAARGREPDDLAKMAQGCLIFAGGIGWLALAPLVAGSDGRVAILWAIAFHLLSNIGWLFLAPTSIALFAAKAPPRLRGTMIGVNSLTIFFASLISGRIGGLYVSLPPSQFWLIHAAIAIVGGLAIFALARPLRRMLAGSAEAEVR